MPEQPSDQSTPMQRRLARLRAAVAAETIHPLREMAAEWTRGRKGDPAKRREAQAVFARYREARRGQ